MDHLPDPKEALNHFLGETPLSWGPERRYCQMGKLLYPAGGRLPGIFQNGRPLRSLQATYEVPE